METTDEMPRYAIVTGASSGLGKSFALELASRKIDTILVSLPGEGIEGVCAECRKMGTDSVFYEIDLTNQQELLAMTGEINRKYRVNILINNAGTGGSDIFSRASVKYINRIIQLNACATTLMTHSDAAVVVAAGLLGQRLEKRLLGRGAGDLGEVRDRLETPAGARGLEVLDSH